jgi:UDP-4-amino-4,6-dideoxy-N-acetyl-beta-L-altrosamine transaminase
MTKSSTQQYLPYGRHVIEEDDIEAVVNVLKSDLLTSGPTVQAFEDAFAKEVGAPYCVVFNSGTSALHLAALALGIGPGDAVIVPAVTFLASANCIEYVGGEVVFADIDPATGLMEAEHIEAAIHKHPGKKFKAVIPVHLNGQTADLERINALAQKHNLQVIEDSCHALGGTYKTINGEETKIGTGKYSSLAMFSMHPVKTIAMGEGGVLTTRDKNLADHLKCLRSHGMERNSAHFKNREMGFDANGTANPWYYEMQELGYNFRASDIHCALGLSQLKKLGRFVQKRTELVSAYLEQMPPLEAFMRPIQRTNHGQPGWHLFPVLCDFTAIGMTRGEFMAALTARGIGTQVHYIPVPIQPYYSQKYGHQSFPGALKYYSQILSLPLFPAMNKANVTYVTNTIAEIISSSNRHAKLYA